MNLTLAKLKDLIKEEMMNENQTALGIPHGPKLHRRPEVLYQAGMKFLMDNPDLGPNSPRRADGELFHKIVGKTIPKVVMHSQHRRGDMDLVYKGDHEGYMASIGHETTPEETEYMKEQQGKLKMLHRALGDALGGMYRHDAQYKSWQAGQRDFFRNNPDYTPGDNDY